MDAKGTFVALLRDIATTINKLSPEQFDQMAAGDARLAFVPPGGKVVVAGPDVGPIRAKLSATESRQAAVAYLDSLGLKNDELRSLAKQLSVAVLSKDPKPTLVQKIVDATAGAREDTAAIHSTNWR
ncbi:hypothetical protein ACFFWC_07725 [Plantactinospora siamensis]|uniref:Uncharacterized protein n=1 Tax=Plantactinospora siamensis TaxID=555372 RepID=A0ABV6NZM5_9ACTN